jgi:hypothetical protein
MLTLLCSCDKDEIIFDHELPMFETREGYQLLEVIMPQGTATDDEIYIVGAFNGGEDAAVGNPQWQLEKAQQSDVKWGIYLDPSNFVNGKTLADGYYFYSKAQGAERTVRNADILHYENPAVGSRQNVYVGQWAKYFETPVNADEITHDGYTVFVSNQTGWDDVTLYMWGDVNDLNGGWPGMTPTGTQTINGVSYLYFDMGEANTGLAEDLIFSNNGSSQLPDFAFTIDHDVYLEISKTGAKEIDPETYTPGGSVTPDPDPTPNPSSYYTIYVEDQSGWDSLYLYAWGDKEIFGGWPGAAPTGSATVDGVDYKTFVVEGAGETENLIFNNNNGSQFDGPTVTLDHDMYITITDSSYTLK